MHEDAQVQRVLHWKGREAPATPIQLAAKKAPDVLSRCPAMHFFLMVFRIADHTHLHNLPSIFVKVVAVSTLPAVTVAIPAAIHVQCA